MTEENKMRMCCCVLIEEGSAVAAEQRCPVDSLACPLYCTCIVS